MGDDDSAIESNRLIEEQISQNKFEIEQKRKALTEEQFRIIKSQGAQTWSPTRGTPLGGVDNLMNDLSRAKTPQQVIDATTKNIRR